MTNPGTHHRTTTNHPIWLVLCTLLMLSTFRCTGPTTVLPEGNETLTEQHTQRDSGPTDSSHADKTNIDASPKLDTPPQRDTPPLQDTTQTADTKPDGPPPPRPEPPLDDAGVGPEPPPVPDTTQTADKAPVKGSAGCGKTSKAGFTCYTVTFEGAKRNWCMMIPTSYDKQRPYNLVLGLHGCGGNNKSVHKHRAPMEKNGEKDFLFAYPQAKSSCWSDKDIPFVKHVISLAQSKHCLDSKRTFVHGMSSGGGMSTKVARAGLVKAFASVSGGGGATAMPAWYYAGTTDSYYKTISSGVQYQHRVNGCKKTSKPIPGTPCVKYDGCKHAMTYCEDKRGHVWPKENWCQGGILDFFRAVP